MVDQNKVAVGAVAVVAVGITVLHFTSQRSNDKQMKLVDFFKDEDFKKVNMVKKLMMIIRQFSLELLDVLYKAIVEFLRQKAFNIF